MVGLLKAGALCVLMAIVAGCSGGSSKGPGGPGGTALNDSAQYLSVLRLAENGACEQALPQLRCMAARGPGFEGPQHVLGYCLMEKAAAAPAGDTAWSAEGLLWITRAANAGWGAAQAQLVSLYADGMVVPQDVRQAQKWRLVHTENPMRKSLGLPELDSITQVQLDRLLTNDVRKKAQLQADAWQRTSWVSANEPNEAFQAACTALLKGPAEKQQPPQRPGPGNGPGKGKH